MVCDVSFRANGLHRKKNLVQKAAINAFVTQASNAEILANADRHLVF